MYHEESTNRMDMFHGHNRFHSSHSTGSDASGSSLRLPYRLQSDSDSSFPSPDQSDSYADKDVLKDVNRTNFYQENRPLYQTPSLPRQYESADNSVVLHLQQQIALQNQEISMLRQENVFLKQQNTTLVSTIGSVSALSRSTVTSAALPTSPAIVPALNQGDYPNIQYWQRKPYSVASKETGVTSTSDSESITATSFHFAEDKNGIFLGEARVLAIKGAAIDIFHDLGQRGLAPGSGWSTAGITAKSEFRRMMENYCPELRFCDANWKADWVATQTYSNWKASHGAKYQLQQHSIKSEEVDNEMESPEPAEHPSRKRKTSHTNGGPPRKRPVSAPSHAEHTELSDADVAANKSKGQKGKTKELVRLANPLRGMTPKSSARNGSIGAVSGVVLPKKVTAPASRASVPPPFVPASTSHTSTPESFLNELSSAAH
ncbi:hypothetical protein K438DRAFT_1966053 [Mycena galopus ATCC 62051]|nr:hypothetical protein K438DRAFT_1966053 [Mycena galopus ATCC 62051]